MAEPSWVYMSAAKQIHVSCHRQNAAFYECKQRDANPAACLEAGKQVTSCVNRVLDKIKAHAPKEFDAYCKCMDYYSNRTIRCRTEQAAFEEACPIEIAGIAEK
uniref:Uncharacterized protein n=1 Tax=Prasinoderma singulare TaxID=676789 RepID=A0A7S3BVC7_9VIRI|mmetsp:Transcript_318/g.881  ORF Transcript_318/g.881 Transcript_318/m.881 type:complete len:104 (+) Transcript_318:176-487(+)|eukprot:CAMPEP_0119170832 /NCGR_PEP_ID=MMETSP1315-20130426/21590_1 /TAXON_ID=676789 /ORGANISM="Prasinoderma singularis, Strain RCC927" /LENGTH=103 /DNA_ID=CAMNT_0007164623 /DNA_START=114 /DNA_END=425 /DNA_ORIENTATION=+